MQNDEYEMAEGYRSAEDNGLSRFIHHVENA